MKGLGMNLGCLCLAAFSFMEFSEGGYIPPNKYLIVSNAQNGTISYIHLSRDGNHSTVHPLIEKQLIHPQGIAVDQKRQLLLIADSELKKVVSYGLMVYEDGSLGVDDQTPVAEDIEARWVAVDGLGNIYATDEDRGKILKVTARQVLDGDTRAKSVFADPDRGDDVLIRAPGGVTTDNFHLYWTNKEHGEKIGTVMKALEPIGVGGRSGQNISQALPNRGKSLAKNEPKAYGLCLALDNVFFTGHDKHVYAVRASGDGDVTRVTSDLENPRGCVWDGESTVFVADRSADSVFAIPGPMYSLAEAPAQKIATVEGAFGVAIFSSAKRAMEGPVGALLCYIAVYFISS